MKIKITSDSTVDLPDSILASNNVDITYFSIVLGEQLLQDRVDCTPATIFDYVSREKKLPKTSAINAETFKQFFAEFADYDHVIHIGLSGGISLAYENAVAAAKEFSNVSVVDGRSLSTGTALMVLYAVELAERGVEPAEICAKIESIRDKVQASFVVDTMEYLYKGGRCSGLAAYIASKLSIKPTIVMDGTNGKMRPSKKYMASTHKAIMRYVDDTLKDHNTPDLRRIFITHSGADEEIIEKVRERIAETYPFKEIIVTTAGSTITSHCGKGTLGILYINTPLD